jgi:hypothetical protein
MPIYNPPIGFYSQVSIPDYVNIRHLIGYNGCNFKYITNKSGVSYIWHDRVRHVIEVWSSYRRAIPIAVDMLNKRISQFNTDPYVSTYWGRDGGFNYELEGSRSAVMHYYLSRIKTLWYDAYIEDVYEYGNDIIWIKVYRKHS